MESECRCYLSLQYRESSLTRKPDAIAPANPLWHKKNLVGVRIFHLSPRRETFHVDVFAR
jgi:hypothetical protein